MIDKMKSLDITDPEKNRVKFDNKALLNGVSLHS